jgi:hypothetical protein
VSEILEKAIAEKGRRKRSEENAKQNEEAKNK